MVCSGRKAFTLIELLVVIAIMGVMVCAGVVSFNSSRGASRLFATARDVMSMIRRARAVALVTQKPAVIVYSNETVEDEACVKVELQAMKLFTVKTPANPVRTLDGELAGEAEDHESEDESSGGETLADEKKGESLEDVLSPQQLPPEVARGVKIKVLEINEDLQLLENESKASKISIFSTADNVSRTLSAESKAGESADLENSTESPVKVVFAENGTVRPAHKIWLYEEGSSPEKGILIEVDRFGEPKCASVDDQD